MIDIAPSTIDQAIGLSAPEGGEIGIIADPTTGAPVGLSMPDEDDLHGAKVEQRSRKQEAGNRK
jgi:hypothetical protein